MTNIWYKDKTVEDNLTCDICGYRHHRPDKYAIVIKCTDGLLRCKVCRGAAKFNREDKKGKAK